MTDGSQHQNRRERPGGMDASPDSQQRGDEAVQGEGCCAITASKGGKGGETLSDRPTNRQATSCPDSISAVQLRISVCAQSSDSLHLSVEIICAENPNPWQLWGKCFV